MAMGFGAVPRRFMRVLVVRIVHMPVRMHQGFVGVQVVMPLAQVQPNP